MDIQLLTNLKLRDDYMGCAEKTQNEIDDWDAEPSLP
jgi:hypothetical protein